MGLSQDWKSGPPLFITAALWPGREAPPESLQPPRPLPVMLGLLDQQPSCCAEIQEHKRPPSGKGWGWECGQPSSMLTVTIGAFRAGRPLYHQRLCRHKGGILGSGARRSTGEAPLGTLGKQGTGMPLQTHHNYFCLLGLSVPLVNQFCSPIFKIPSSSQDQTLD